MARPTFVAAGIVTGGIDNTLSFNPGTSDFIVFGAGRGTSPTWRGSGTGLTIRQTAANSAFFENTSSIITTATPGSGSGTFNATNREWLAALSLSGVTGFSSTGNVNVPDSSATTQSATVSCGADQLIVFWAMVNGTPSTVAGSSNTTVRAIETNGTDRTFVIGTSTGNIDLGGWAAVSRGRHIQWVVLDGTSASTLTVTTQPTTGTSGVALSPSFVVQSSNSGFTGNVTIEKVSGDPTIGGTLTVAAVAGVATFANVIPTGTGSLVLRATAAGHDPVTFDAITVNAPAGTLFRPYFLTG